MRRTLIPSLLLVLVLTVTAGASWGQVSYTGSLSWSDGPTSCLTANGIWANSATSISWIVSQDAPGGAWTYEYALGVGDRGAISHAIVEVSPAFTANSMFDVNWGGGVEIDTYTSTDQGASNPGLPNPIYGIKFDNATSVNETFSFKSFIAPTWGDFYAKDGMAGGAQNYVYNSSIGDPDPLVQPSDGSVDCKILRPDTSAAPMVPEVNSLALAMLGVLPMAGYQLRRRR